MVGILLICLTFLSTFFISSLFIKNTNEQIYDLFLDSIDYSVSLKGVGAGTGVDYYTNIETLATYNQTKSSYERTKLLTDVFKEIDNLELVDKSTRVFSVSLKTKSQTYLDNSMINGNKIKYYDFVVFGVDDNYFEDYDLKIVEGRNFRKGDDKVLILPKNATYYIDNKEYKYELGEKIEIDKIRTLGEPHESFYMGYYEKYISDYEEDYFEVIGFYEPIMINVFNDTSDEYFLFNSRYLTPIDSLETIYEEYIDYAKEGKFDDRRGNYLRPNYYNVKFYTDNLDDLIKLNKQIDEIIIKYNTKYDYEYNQKSYSALNSSNTYLDNYSLYADTFNNNKNINFFLYLILIISILLFISFDYYFLNKRKKEIAIKRYLGMSKFKVIKDYSLESLLLSSAALLLSTPISVLIFKIILKNIILNNKNINNLLSHFMNNVLYETDSLLSLNINYLIIIKGMLIIIFFVLIVRIIILGIILRKMPSRINIED